MPWLSTHTELGLCVSLMSMLSPLCSRLLARECKLKCWWYADSTKHKQQHILTLLMLK